VGPPSLAPDRGRRRGILERLDVDNDALIGRLYAREDARWLAELLMDLEDEVGEMARLRLVDGLRRELR
jgi:hypothetical protein